MFIKFEISSIITAPNLPRLVTKLPSQNATKQELQHLQISKMHFTQKEKDSLPLVLV